MNTIVTEPKTIRVPMAGLSFDKPPAVLETLLGSCVGIAMWDERSGYGGLAHAMLAQSNGDVTSPGKFVDTAISELKRELIAQGATPYSMRAKLAGGAIMFGNNSETVGTKNFEAARHHLALLLLQDMLSFNRKARIRSVKDESVWKSIGLLPTPDSCRRKHTPPAAPLKVRLPVLSRPGRWPPARDDVRQLPCV